MNHLTYDSYGQVTSETNPNVDFRYGYTGRERDEETGLDYYRSRYYDPSNGRFISEDTIGFNGGDTNLYRYVANSPIRFADPNGTDLYDVVNGADQVFAGFGDAVTFGGTTKLREAMYGETATRNHSGGLFTTGQVLGTGASIAVGVGAPGTFVKGATFAQRFAQGYTVVGAGVGAYQSTRHIIEGCATPLDALAFAPLVGVGLNRGIRFIDGRRTIPLYRAVKDPELSNIQNTGAFQNVGLFPGKYFSTTEEGAASYAKQAYYGFKDPAHTTVQTGIQKRFITPDMRGEVDRGINSIVIPKESLPNLNTPKILPTMSIPKK